MTIKTKYNIGDVAYVMYKNKVTSIKIVGMDINIEEGFDGQYILPATTRVVYYDFGKYHLFNEQDLFPTKEELLKSL